MAPYGLISYCSGSFDRRSDLYFLYELLNPSMARNILIINDVFFLYFGHLRLLSFRISVLTSINYGIQFQVIFVAALQEYDNPLADEISILHRKKCFRYD